MNKKAQILYYALILGIFFAFLYFIVLQIQQHATPQQYTGSLAVNALNVAERTELILLYYEQAARLSSYNALPELARHGGYITPACATYLGASVISLKCTPDLNVNFQHFFNEQMKQRLEMYPPMPQQLTSSLSVTPHVSFVPFKIYTDKKMLVAASGKPLDVTLSILGQEAGTYSLRPDLRVEMVYDFDLLGKVREKMDYLKGLEDSTKFTPSTENAVSVVLGSCPAKTPEDVFFDVVERVSSCAKTVLNAQEKATCTCSLPSDVSALGSYRIILREKDNSLVAELVSNDNVPVDVTKEIRLAIHEGSPFRFDSLVEKNEVVLTIDAGKMLIDGKPVSSEKALLRYKDIKNLITFVSDDQQDDFYKQIPSCSSPTLKKFRVCITAGKVPQFDKKTQQTPFVDVHFQVAVDVS